MNAFLAGCLGKSRRYCDELIKAGRVTVHGVAAHPGIRVDHLDEVRLDSRVVTARAFQYLLLNKPRGIITAVRDARKRTVTDLLPAQFRHLFPVGRLDRDSRGLLLMTNDGELAERILHPRFAVPRKYRVRLDKPVDVGRVRLGVLLEDGFSRFDKALTITGVPEEIDVVLAEGRKRQIRRTFETIGYRVVDLVRTEMAGITLGDIPEGKYRELSEREVERLKAEYGGKA